MNRYGQYCPIAKALELLGEKWTLLILREMLNGRSRFGELQRGLPRLSPALLTKRLKQLETSGLVVRRPVETGTGASYHLTEAGQEAAPIIQQLGLWGIRWADARIAREEATGQLLMEDVRRCLDTNALPGRHCAMRFELRLSPGSESWWLITSGREVDLCDTDPGHEIDVFIEAELQGLVDYWFGRSTLRDLRRRGSLTIRGRSTYVRTLGAWLGRSALVASS